MVSALNAGGVETLLYSYYTHFNKEQFRFDILVTCGDDKPGVYYDKFKELGCQIFLLPHKTHVFKYHKELKKVLKNGEYDIIHVHQDEMSFQSLFCAKKCGIKTRIAHAHHTYKLKGMKAKVFKFLTNKTCTHRFACSNEAGKILFGKKQFYVMTNAIEHEKYLFNDNERKKLRKEYNLKNKVVIGTIARVAEQKNPEFALNVIEKLMKERDDIVYFWIGNGPLLDKLRSEIVNRKLEDRAFFLGEKFDAYRYYNMFDMFFLPSKEEGFGISALEAQFNGLKTIVSNGFPKEVSVVEGYVDFYNLDEKVEQWVEKMLNAIDSIPRSRNVLDKVTTNDFFIDNSVKKLENKYEEMNLKWKELF